MDFQESKTKENLARSFAAECQEGARYQFLAKQAMKEQFVYMSGLIRTLAHNEMAHANLFFQKIAELGGANVRNIEINAGYPFKNGNLCDVLKYESENEEMSGNTIYPEFAKIAKDEGFQDVATLFNEVAKVELSHEKILKQLHDGVCSKNLYKCKDGDCSVFKCDECGHTEISKQAPKECPLCHMPQGYYRIDVTLYE